MQGIDLLFFSAHYELPPPIPPFHFQQIVGVVIHSLTLSTHSFPVPASMYKNYALSDKKETRRWVIKYLAAVLKIVRPVKVIICLLGNRSLLK